MDSGINMKGYYTATNSDLYIKVYHVYHISKRTGKIKMKAEVFYKSNGEPCYSMNPHGSKHLELIYDVVKHWEIYIK
tara:strand:+ start:2365 stop:2595 length:231 start_codon:yes stop_codon:yes gene_type:complete